MLIKYGRDKTMCECSANVAFDKATNGQTDIKHEMRRTLSSMSLLKIVGEKLPHSQRSSLENHTSQTGKQSKSRGFREENVRVDVIVYGKQSKSRGFREENVRVDVIVYGTTV